MTTSTEPKTNEQLLREGVQAARTGNKALARDRLWELVKRDEKNERGWLWLASVVDDPNEKRLCLSNVLVINPGNSVAKRELTALEKNLDVVGQVGTRNRSVIPLLLLIVLVIGLAGVFLIIRPFGSHTNTSQTPSQSGGQTENSAVIQDTIVPTSVTMAKTQPVIITAVSPATLPPTWTPQASPTSAFGATGTPLRSVPPGLMGHLAVLSGQIITPDGFLPIEIMSPDGSNVQMAVQSPDRGEYALLLPDDKHLIYSYITSGTGSVLMRMINLNGSQPRDVSEGWGNFPPLYDQHAGALSADGQLLAFSGHNILQNELYSAIYVLNLKPFLNGTVGFGPTSTATGLTATPPNNSTSTPIPPGTIQPGTLTATPSAADLYLVRVTPKNIGENGWPTISPDGHSVAFVTDTTKVGVNGIDLYSAAIMPDSQVKQLTTDGAKLNKSSPAWSPDGKWIAFTSAAPDNSFSNIELIDPSGANRHILVHLGNTHNFRPHWSPDSKYLAFTSDRTGKDEVFILNVSDGTLYQVTQDVNTNIVTDWGR